jgi:hypothetical protein
MSSNREKKKIEKESAELQALVRQTQRDTSNFLLNVLQSIIKEQVIARQLEMGVGAYLYNAVKDQAQRKEWID